LRRSLVVRVPVTGGIGAGCRPRGQTSRRGRACAEAHGVVCRRWVSITRRMMCKTTDGSSRALEVPAQQLRH
jgi:hypothetical protein